MMIKRLTNKLLMGIIIFHILALSLLPPFTFTEVKAAADSPGFIIQADWVVGKNMTPSIVFTETSGSDKTPMLRVHYEEAVIYGMKLTKQFSTPSGPVSLTLKADGPVRMSGMTVDTSSLSFKGACLRATENIPDAGLEDVTMVVHYMNAGGSNIEQLSLQTVDGNQGPAKPKKTQILVDLALLPYTQALKEVEKISSGKKPLVCDEPVADEGDVKPGEPKASIPDELSREDLVPGEEVIEDRVGKVTDPVTKVIDPATGVIEPVTGITDPITDPVKDIVKPVEKVIKPVTKPVKKVLKPVTKPVKKIVKPVTKPVKEVVKPVEEKLKPVTAPVKHALSESCKRVKDTKGKITKDLGLDLIDQALKEGKTLPELCKGDASLTRALEDFEDGLTDILGLDFIFKALGQDEEAKLKRMKETLKNQKDNFIISL
ncbi:hypothetical protein [Peribacillus glennii]|uniref:Uncharacterized protein n=1 Tax=Peribacillus glennii TaxID=2303991 RepID=A0A372LAS1_9BACI|nr:hypothetical protein [Peribacillus glennii]RFU62873.1 hypothetical protein D0466_13045 [Peribacillus glennii]